MDRGAAAMTRDLTMVLPHFMNLGMLEEQQKVWADYPADLRKRLHVIIVDDCSPKALRPGRKSITVTGLASVRLYRLLEKKRWNWLSCRNLGAQVATTDWLLLTDIDHVLPASTLLRLLDGPLERRHAYRFARVDAPHPWPYDLSECSPYKMHNDTWLMERALFYDERVFGYDERLSGLYGTSGEFRDRVVATASAIVVVSDPMVRYPREVIADASTHPSVYTRKNDQENDRELAWRKAERERIPNWRPLHGLIANELMFDSRAEC
jgi:hypothetical protein